MPRDWYFCVLRPARLCLLCCFCVLVPFTAFAQTDNDDFFCHPARAEELRRMVEAIDLARQDNNTAEVKALLTELAENVFLETPTGGFPISRDRWIGAGGYFSELLDLLAPDLQRRILQAVDLTLRARLGATTGSLEDAVARATPEQLHRLARDFPRSEIGKAARPRLAERLLESGELQGYLDLMGADANAKTAAAIGALLEAPSGADAVPPRGPMRQVRELEWNANTTFSSPFVDGLRRRRPVIDDERAYLQSVERVLCMERNTGAVLWETPFLVDFDRYSSAPPSPLPGSALAPTLYRDVVVCSSPRAVTAFSRDDGSIRWEVELGPLFPRGSDEAAATTAPVLATSPPIAAPRGVLVTVSQLRGGSLTQRLLLIGPAGKLLWNRVVGTATGATYMALGAAYPSVAVSGDRAVVLTQRGFLSVHHLVDGALHWSVRYPSFPASGSRDALRYRDRTHAPEVTAHGNYIVGAPLDAASVFVWDSKSGTLVAQLPRSGDEWWQWRTSQSSFHMTVTTPRGITFWKLQTGRLQREGRCELPNDLPDIAGPPTHYGATWYLPHIGGYYEARTAEDWQFRLLPTAFQVQRITPLSSTLLLADSETTSALLAPYSDAALQAPTPAGAILRARSLLHDGDASSLLAALHQLPPTPAGTPEEAQLFQLSSELFERARFRALGLSEDEQLQLIEKMLERISSDGAYAQIAYEQAVAAARRGYQRLATRFAYLALQSPREAPVRVGPDFHAPVELAVQRLLQRLSETYGELPEREVHEATARKKSENARVGDDLQAHLSLAREHPRTVAGRESLLRVASKYLRRGNRTLAAETLRQLVLIEPQTPEAIVARIHLVELYTIEKRFTAARALLQELQQNFADHPYKGGSRRDPSLTVGERVTQLRAAIPADAQDAAYARTNRALPLEMVWRSPTLMTQQRRADVRLIPADATSHSGDNFLVVSEQAVELRASETGTPLWTTRFAPADATQRLYLRDNTIVTDTRAVVSDSETVYSVALEDGEVMWQHTLPEAQVEGESYPVGLDFVVVGDGVVVLGGGDQTLHTLDFATGAVRWSLSATPEYMGQPSIASGKLLLAWQDGGVIEVRDLSDGSILRTFPYRDEANEEYLTQVPWFVGADRFVVPLESGRLLVVDANTGATVWETQLPAPLIHVHRVPELPFLIPELPWAERTPMLLGIDARSGQMLWKKGFRSRHESVRALHYHNGDLYLLSGGAGRRKLIRVEMPPIFLHPDRWEQLPQPEPLATLWTAPLNPRIWEEPTLHFDRDYVMASYHRVNPEVTIFSREHPQPVRPVRFAEMNRFLRGRDQLFHSGFVGNTLVVLTARGAAGFRTKGRWELTEQTWRALQEIDPVDVAGGFPTPVLAARCAYLSQGAEAACRILETALEDPRLRASVRRRLLRELAGVAEQRGEEAPPEWSVPRLRSAPEIDGSLAEDWNAATAIDVRSARYFHAIQGYSEDAARWRGWQDLSALVYTGWSDEGFHLALDVIDDSVHPYDRDALLWKGDCLLIAIDYENDGGLQPNRNDQLLTLALTVPKPAQPGGGGGQDGNNDPPPDEAEDDNEPQGAYQVQRKKDGSGVIYEMTIPWASFERNRPGGNAVPHRGMAFRVNLVLTDDDNGRGSESYLSLSPGQRLAEEQRGIWDLFAPSYFPKLILEE
ncbi:MAG: PQQ-binding-like beta-propeller repeat protein [Planctomycetota bacterium]